MKPSTTPPRCPTCGAPIEAQPIGYWLITVKHKYGRARVVVTATYREARAMRAGETRIVPWHPPMSLHDTRPKRKPPSEVERERARERARRRSERARQVRDERKQEEREQIARWLEDGATCPVELEPLPALGDPSFYGAIRVNGRMYFLNRAHWWPREVSQ